MMRVSFISDLHLDLNPKNSKENYHYELLKVIENEKTDLFVIGGDLTNHYHDKLFLVFS